MTKKDYTKYSESSKNEEIKNDNVQPEVTPEVETNIEPEVTPEVETNVEPENENIDEIVIGIVTASKLNVRIEPNKDAEVLDIIVKDAEVEVNVTKSTEDFYKISITINDVLVEGYCMKEFIHIEL